MIVRLVSRFRSVTISAGPKGPLYSVTSPSGQTLVSNASLEQLRDGWPDLYDQLKPMISPQAASDASADRVLWAGKEGD